MAQTPDEKTYVEIPFIEQLKGTDWDHIEGDNDVEKGSHLFFREPYVKGLLLTHVCDAMKMDYVRATKI